MAVDHVAKYGKECVQFLLHAPGDAKARVDLAGIELKHTIRKGQFNVAGCDGISFADQLYALARQVCPK